MFLHHVPGTSADDNSGYRADRSPAHVLRVRVPATVLPPAAAQDETSQWGAATRRLPRCQRSPHH